MWKDQVDAAFRGCRNAGTPLLKGLRFESLEEAQSYLYRWETHSADSLPSEAAKLRELLLKHTKPRKISEDTIQEHLRDLFDKLGFGGPEDADADEAGIALKKPKPPNLNSGSAAASLD